MASGDADRRDEMGSHVYSSTKRFLRSLGILPIAAIVILALAPEEALAQWKVVHWNVMSGFGKGGVQGSCSFTPGSTCSSNAWGNGSGPLAQRLVQVVKNDASVVALTLNEAWTCAKPLAIASLLGWSSSAIAPNDTTEREIAGVSILARYGFAPYPNDSSGNRIPNRKALTKCSSTADQRWVVYAPVYVNSAKTKVVHVYATHWTGCDIEATETRDFMQLNAYKPRSFTGDLNVKDGVGNPITILTNTNYKDVWPRLNGTANGDTATWNSGQYGNPINNLYKRIDYAFYKNGDATTGSIDPTAMGRFNHDGTPGTCKESDHAGIVVTYKLP
jgi:hypothetical protein